MQRELEGGTHVGYCPSFLPCVASGADFFFLAQGLYLSDIQVRTFANTDMSHALKVDQDHLITMTQNLNHYEKILSRSHSNYLAQISIEMTDANNQINDVLSKLTALGTVLVPMNLITGDVSNFCVGV